MLAVVEKSVGGRGSDGCKQDPVGNGNRCRNKEGAVSLISLDVEGEIGVDDPRDVVLLSRIIERK
jgi:hypothetical protein